MRRISASGVLLILCQAACLPAAEPDRPTTQAEMERIAGELNYLSLAGIVYDRTDRIPEVEHPERHEKLVRQVLDVKYPAQDLLALLDHPSPKVRTLAAAALYYREDPQYLPALFELCDDQAESFLSYPYISRTGLMKPTYGPPTQKNSVASFVSLMVGMYLRASGDFAIHHLQHPDFEDYWAARKDRAYCAGWFRVQLGRASQGSFPTQENRIEKIRAVRQRIDKLPPDDRTWVLLWLQDSAGYDALVTEEELLAACQQVGREKLLLLLQKKIPTDDPDLQLSRQSGDFQYQMMMCFVLRHAEELLKPEDSAALLAREAWEREYRQRGIKKPYLTPWWAVAAARLNQEQAGSILHAALTRFQGEHDADKRSVLCNALWELEGEEESKFLVDWFYNETPERGLSPNCRSRFIDTAVKGTDARPLIAQLIRDPRFPEIDWQTLEQLAWAVNGWNEKLVVSKQELEDARHPFGEGHYHWQRPEARLKYPEETARLEAKFQRWREQLLASVPNWAGSVK